MWILSREICMALAMPKIEVLHCGQTSICKWAEGSLVASEGPRKAMRPHLFFLFFFYFLWIREYCKENWKCDCVSLAAHLERGLISFEKPEEGQIKLINPLYKCKSKTIVY